MKIDPDKTESNENHYRPGERSSGPGGKHRKSYERYGNYGMVDTDDEEDENVSNENNSEIAKHILQQNLQDKK